MKFDRQKVLTVKRMIRDFFFAPSANCLGCLSPLGADKGFLCAKCYASLSPLYTTSAGTKHVCLLCGNEISGLRCRCGGSLKNAVTSYSAYHFEAPVSTMIKKFKYSSVTKCAEWMADEMIRALRGEREFDMITFVPMHALRRIRRGFNQSEILASFIAEKLGIPLLPVLSRPRFTKRQATLRGKKRRTNLIHAFRITNANIRNKRILLIDDVRTTGTTVISCAKVLMDHGAKSVSALTLASSRIK